MQLQKDLSRPNLCIGKDIHKKSFYVSMRTDIAVHKSWSMPADSKVLIDYVLQHFPTHNVVLTYEAGCCGFSTARDYLHLGWDVVVVNAADVPTSHKQSYQKTDKIDSVNLCKQLQMGNLSPINIPTEAQEQFRSLLRHRISIAKRLRTSKNSIKSMLLFHGIKVPDEHDNSHWSKNFRAWIETIEWSNECGKSSMAHKLSDFEYIYGQYKSVSNELRAYAKKTYPTEYELLRSIPGIGGFIAAALLAEIGNFDRFNNEAQFSSFIGVVPGIYNSGGSEQNLGVTPRANRTLRPLLVEAVWVAVSRDPEIQQYYKKHIGKNPKSIVIKIAHKMARRIFAVIKTKQAYQINKNLLLDTKLALPIEATEIIQDSEQD